MGAPRSDPRSAAGRVRAYLLGLALALAGCSPGADKPPPPVLLDDEATAYYCGMIVITHPGPKAQIHVEGRADPLWFTSVVDGFAYLQSGEREGRILAFYVQDMGRAKSWEHPGRDAWIPARSAFYVWGSDRKGGMGTPALVPFAERAAAEAFVRIHYGRILDYREARTLPLLDGENHPDKGEKGS